MDRDEIHHKMSKKVAQLTKVIFHLNTRNDEADQHLSAVTQAYEQEVEFILKDANSKVRKLAEAIESGQSNKAMKQIEALKKGYEDEKRDALKEIQNLKSTLSARETKNTSIWTDRLSRMNSEVLALKQQCTQQALQFKAALQRAEEGKSQGEVELRASFEAEINRLRREHQASLDSLEAEHKAQLQEIRSQHSAAEASWQRQLDDERRHVQDLEERLTEARRRLSEDLASGDEALQAARAERDALSQQLADTRDALAKAEQAHGDSLKTLQQRDEEIATLKATCATLEEQRRSLEADVGGLRKNLADAQEELSRLQKSYEALQARSIRDQSQAEAAATAEKQRLEDEVKALQSQLSAKELEEANLKASIAKLQDEVAGLTKALDSQRVECQRLQQALDEARRRNEEIAQSGGSEAARLQAELDAARATIASLETKLVAKDEEFTQKLQEAQRDAAQHLEEEQRRHDEAAALLRRQHESEVAELQSSANAKLEQLRSDYEAQIADLRRQLESTDEGGRLQLQEKSREIATLQQRVQELERLVSDAQRQREEDLRQIRSLEDQLAGARAELADVKRDADLLRQQHAEELDRARRDLQQRLDASTESHQREIKTLREEMAKALANSSQEGNAQVQRLQAEIRRLKDEHEAEIRELKKKISDISAEADVSRREAQAELARLKSDANSQLEKVRAEGIEMVQKLTAEHQAKLSEISERHTIALDELKNRLGKSHQERVDEMRAQHAKQIQELKASHEESMRTAVAAHTASMQKVQKEHSDAIATLEVAAKAAEERHKAQLQAVEVALQREKDVVASTRQEVAKLQGDLRDLRNEYDVLQERLKATIRSHEEAMARQQEDFAREKRNLKEQHKRGLEQLLESQLKEVAALKEQFDRARHLQDLQIEMLQKRCEELQELYDSRPSREEDLLRIADLEREVEEQKAIVKRLMDDMQFYKLELVNREQNYNKMFGAAPTVGIMNPLAAAKKGTAAPGAPPPMRLVQQPGAGMNGLNMALPPLGMNAAPLDNRSQTKSKSVPKPPSSGQLRRAGSMD
jgi:chromosome segregation ATPase